MTKQEAADYRGMEEWSEALRMYGAEEKMTPKQIAIVEAAVNVFADKGYAAASTGEIARLAGVAEGTIFRYYKTKKDLLMAIVGPSAVKLITPFLLSNFKDVLEAPYDSFPAFLKTFALNRLEFARKYYKILKILIQEIPFEPVLRDQYKELVISKIFAQMEEIVRHFQDKGELAPLPPAVIIRFTASSLLGFLITRLLLLPESEWDDELEIDRTIHMIVQGVGISDAGILA